MQRRESLDEDADASMLLGPGKQINDEVGVNAVVRGFEEAWNRHDMDALATLFANDADFVNVIGMRWVGRDAIKQSHAASHASKAECGSPRLVAGRQIRRSRLTRQLGRHGG
jgi:hypothetical protein